MTDFLKHTFDARSIDHVSALDELAFWSAPFGIVLLDTIKMKKNIRALDIGFGTGFPLMELAERLGASSEIYGIDIWENAVDRARQKIQARRLRNVTTVVQPAEILPFEDRFFDLIVSNNGLNNVEDPEKVFSEVFRTSKMGAQLVFTVNLPETMIEFYQIYEAVLRDSGLNEEVLKMKQHIHEKRKPLEETRSLVRNAGFKIEREILDDFAYHFADGTDMFGYHVIREFFLPAWTELLPQDRVQIIFSEIESRLNRLASKNGEVRLSVPFVCMDCSKF